MLLNNNCRESVIQLSPPLFSGCIVTISNGYKSTKMTETEYVVRINHVKKCDICPCGYMSLADNNGDCWVHPSGQTSLDRGLRKSGLIAAV